jgi:hypothetical protein
MIPRGSINSNSGFNAQGNINDINLFNFANQPQKILK